MILATEHPHPILQSNNLQPRNQDSKEPFVCTSISEIDSDCLSHSNSNCLRLQQLPQRSTTPHKRFASTTVFDSQYTTNSLSDHSNLHLEDDSICEHSNTPLSPAKTPAAVPTQTYVLELQVKHKIYRLREATLAEFSRLYAKIEKDLASADSEGEQFSQLALCSIKAVCLRRVQEAAEGEQKERVEEAFQETMSKFSDLRLRELGIQI